MKKNIDVQVRKVKIPDFLHIRIKYTRTYNAMESFIVENEKKIKITNNAYFAYILSVYNDEQKYNKIITKEKLKRRIMTISSMVSLVLTRINPHLICSIHRNMNAGIVSYKEEFSDRH